MCESETAVLLAGIRERAAADKETIREAARVVHGKVVISLTFDDEGDLVSKWITSVGDINALLAILDGRSSS